MLHLLHFNTKITMMLQQLFSSTCVDLSLCKLTKSRSLKTNTAKNRMSLLFSSPHEIIFNPNIIIPHPYQEIEDVLLFPHPPSRQRTPKACTYNKQHEYSIHIPSWKYASTPDTIFTHQKIEKLLLFPTSTLSLINNEGLHLQKTKMSILSSSPS